MNKRIVLSLIAATLLATGSAFAGVAFAGGNGTGHSMMGSSGMMYGPTQASQGGSSTGGTPINRNAPYMMRGYGMGTGMMGGYGMGPGMMGGYGMGTGMMGGYGAHVLGLSADQRDKIAEIRNGSLSKAWPIMGQLREQYFQFYRLTSEESPDRAAVNKAFARINSLRMQLLDLRLDARRQMLGVLTADQRKELQQGFYRYW